MKKLTIVVCMALGLAACGGGGGSSSDATGPSAEALKAKVAVPDPTLAAQAISVVNSTTAGDQVIRAVGALADGGYSVAWISGDTTLLIQRYDSGGNKVGGEVSVPIVVEASTSARTGLTVLSDGKVVVVRRTTDPTRLTAAITVSVFDANGTLVREAEVDLSADFSTVPASYVGYQPQVAPLASGGFVVLWQRLFTYPRLGTETAVLTQRFDSQGAAVGSPIQIVGDLADGRVIGANIRLTTDAQGGYTVSLSAGNWSGGFTYSTVHVDASGTATQIISSRPGATLLLPLEGDRFVLFTKPFSAATAQMLDSAGNPVGDLTTLAGTPFAATELLDGSFVVFLVSNDAVTAQQGTVTAQRFSSTGAPIGNLLPLANGTAVPLLPDGSVAAAVSSLADGGFAAAWSAWPVIWTSSRSGS
jgi:hypothetical protein